MNKKWRISLRKKRYNIYFKIAPIIVSVILFLFIYGIVYTEDILLNLSVIILII